MPLKLTNNAASTLATAISASDTTVSIKPGDAGKFPSLSAGDWFPLTVVDAAGNMEIMRVTARNGSVFTVQRAQEDTTAKAFSNGSRADLRITAKAIIEAQMVLSVAGKTGHIVLGIEDVQLLEAALNSIDTQINNFATNFSKIDLTKDANKPVSNAQKTALDQKLDKSARASDSAKLDGKTISQLWAAMGAAQSLAGNGYTKLPSGWIIQWGRDSLAGDTSTPLPIRFPGGCAVKLATVEIAYVSNMTIAVTVEEVPNPTSIILRQRTIYDGGYVGAPGVAQIINWIAIGW